MKDRGIKMVINRSRRCLLNLATSKTFFRMHDRKWSLRISLDARVSFLLLPVCLNSHEAFTINVFFVVSRRGWQFLRLVRFDSKMILRVVPPYNISNSVVKESHNKIVHGSKWKPFTLLEVRRNFYFERCRRSFELIHADICCTTCNL